ncbi:RHS repeat-associated core domain-containing protein [Bacteroides reticulotermitis]|uniref:RHS repeat-associated core domain-containing protein n=1 Tax=Bacteroides reticulotermitis TaxID=1133319 RepID=UPI003A8884F0
MAKADGTVIQTNHYYPYGMTFAESTFIDKQPYKYNNKELDMENGLNLYDYEARQLDLGVPRFTTIDPLAEKYYSISPYVYVGNNPILYVDPDGREIWIAFNVTNKAGATTQQKVQYKDGKLYGTDGKAYTGGNEYATKVMGDLNQLTKDNTDLAGGITTLQDSKNIHTM